MQIVTRGSPGWYWAQLDHHQLSRYARWHRFFKWR